jgi:hypothetical protein
MAKKNDRHEIDGPDAPAIATRDSGLVTVVLKREHTHRGLRIPAGGTLDLLPRQADALKAAGVAL